MGRLAEVNQSTGIGLKLFDGATDQFPRARVYNAAGTEQTAAPFNSPIALTHRANGFYSASVTPDAEGEFFVIFQVYSDAGFTTLNKKYEEVMEEISVRSVDQDLATLLGRLTATRAGYLDNLPRLDVDVSTRESEASASARAATNQNEHDTTQAGIAAVQADTDDIQSRIGTPAGASLSADVASVKSDSSTLVSRLTAPRAANLDNLDATVSSREAEADAATRAATNQGEHDNTQSAIAAVQADTDDIQSKIGTPAGASVSADVAAVKSDTAGIKTKTDQLTFETGRVASRLEAAQEDSIVNKVWDEPVGDHNSVGTFGAQANLIDDILGVVQGLQASDQDHRLVYQPIVLIPEVGSQIYKVYFLHNANGVPTDPIGGTPEIRHELIDGTLIHDWVALNQESTGVFYHDHTVTAGNARRDLVLKIRHKDDALGPFLTHVALLTESEAEHDVEDILARIGTPVAATISQDIANVQADIDAIETATNPATIADAVWDEPTIDHVAPGSFGEQVNELGAIADPDVIAERVWKRPRIGNQPVGSFGEYVDAKISSRESESSASTRAAQAAKDATVAKEATAQAIKNKTDLIVFDGDKVRSHAAQVSDKAGYSTDAADKAALVDLVWDETTASHNTLGTTGRSLAEAQAGASPAAVADAVWDEATSGHTANGTFGEKVLSGDNRGAQANTKLDEILNSRLTTARSAKLDNLDQPISSRESEVDAAARAATDQNEHDATQAAVAGVAGALAPDARINTVLNLLQDTVYGLANLRIQIDGKATLAAQGAQSAALNAIITALADAGFGLAALKAAITGNLAELQNAGYGLAAIKGAVDTKATAAALAAVPTAAQIKDAVWEKPTGEAVPAGSYGKLVKDTLDAAITTRASGVNLATVDTVVDSIKALLEDVTFGLAALKGEIDANEVKIDAVGAGVTNVDGDVATARADILAAIAAIVNGTPTILAALNAIKGGGWNGVTDSLEAIRDAIGTGSATLGNQNAIIAKLDAMHGPAPAVTDTIKDTLTKIAQATAEVLANRTQLGSKIDTVDAKVVGVDNKATATIARLDNVNYGLQAAKTDRDTYATQDQAGHAQTQSKADQIIAAVANLDGDVATAQAAILAAIGAQDAGEILTKVNGIIALLNSGVGLAAIVNAIAQHKGATDLQYNALATAVAGIDTKADAITALIEGIKGAGWDVGDTLKAISDAVAAVGTAQGTQATSNDAALILQNLSQIKGTGFDPATDTLEKIAERNSQFEGFQAGEA